MPAHIPRCPHCSKSIDVSVAWMDRLRFWSKIEISCPSCLKLVDPEHARIMGNAYGHWAQQFTGELKNIVDQLPILQEVEARRLMGTKVHDEDIHLQQGFDSLTRACIQNAKLILTEKAHGEEADLDVALLLDPGTRQMNLAAVLAKSSVRTGEKEWEMLLARVGKTQYICYIPAAVAGVEQRVRQAVRNKIHMSTSSHPTAREEPKRKVARAS